MSAGTAAAASDGDGTFASAMAAKAMTDGGDWATKEERAYVSQPMPEGYTRTCEWGFRDCGPDRIAAPLKAESRALVDSSANGAEASCLDTLDHQRGESQNQASPFFPYDHPHHPRLSNSRRQNGRQLPWTLTYT